MLLAIADSRPLQVSGKFTALMAIFSTDVRLEGEYKKEFQALVEKQLVLLKSAVEAGQCSTGMFDFPGDGDTDDPLAKAVQDTVEMLKGQVARQRDRQMDRTCARACHYISASQQL